MVQLHWAWLYEQVSLDLLLSRAKGVSATSVSLLKRLGYVHREFCQRLEVSETSVPFDNLRVFYRDHEPHARLKLQYPDAQLFQDCVPLQVVIAYQKTLASESLPESGFQVLAMPERGAFRRAEQVAKDDSCIVFPKASAEACLIAAYALLKCKLLYESMCFAGIGKGITCTRLCLAHKYLCGIVEDMDYRCICILRIVASRTYRAKMARVKMDLTISSSNFLSQNGLSPNGWSSHGLRPNQHQ